jgi:methionyl-tRNA formyltransferase
MNLVLVGSVSSSHAALDALLRAGVDVAGVCAVDPSQAERISDYRDLRPLAEAAGVPCVSFVKISEPAVEAFLRDHPADMVWVIGLSQLFPDAMIERFPAGGVGFHPTMLPQGRGRAPVAWTMLLGNPAAVSLFYLTAEADAGDLIAQREVPVLPDDYSEDLIARTNVVLGEVVTELAPLIAAGRLPRTPQDHAKATHYARRTPADGIIDWTRGTDYIYRLIRAAGRPYPGAFTHRDDGAKLTIWRARPVGGAEAAAFMAAAAGEVVACTADGEAWVRTGDGALALTQVQAEGGAVVSPGRCLRVGERLG